MAEVDKPKTAFVTPLGFWEFNRMLQGITNVPSTFQRLMERCMGNLHLKEVLVFLDDLILLRYSRRTRKSIVEGTPPAQRLCPQVVTQEVQVFPSISALPQPYL